MKLGRVLLIIVGVAVITYGSGKFYLHHKVESQLDQQIVLARPFVDISYQGVGSNLLGGALEIEGIRITPVGEPNSLSIRRLVLKGDGPGFLWDLASGNIGQQPPHHLQLSYDDLTIPLGWQLAAQTSTWLGEAATSLPEACTLGGIFQDAGLDELGFQQLVTNGYLRYSLSPTGGDFSLEMEYDVTGIESGRLEFNMSGLVSRGAMAFQTMPTVNNISFRYQLEPEYSKAMLQHCAQKIGQTPMQFADGLFDVDDSVYEQQLGFVPGDGLRSAMKKLLTGPGELLVSVKPGSNLDFTSLGLYKPEQLVDLLGIEVWVDGQFVSDLSYQLTPGSRELLDKLSNINRQDEEPEKQIQNAKQQRYEKRYVSTSVTALKQHIGRNVKIYTQAEKPRQGTLIAIDNGVASVEQRFGSGTVVLHTQLNNIQKVEVLTSVKVN